MSKRLYKDGKKHLTDKELKTGKGKVRISGTKKPMPWSDIYNRIRMGMSIKHLAEKYGHERLITLWAEQDGIEKIDGLSDLFDSEVVQRRKMAVIETQSPETAKTLKEMVNEYAPDVGRELVKLTASMIQKGQNILNDEDSTTNDMKNIAQAVQTMTDTVEISERFSTNATQGTVNISVPGFEFVLDKPPEAIEAEITDTKNEDGDEPEAEVV